MHSLLTGTFFRTICHLMHSVYTLRCHTSLKTPFEWKLYLTEDCIWLEAAFNPKILLKTAFERKLYLNESSLLMETTFAWKQHLTENFIWLKTAVDWTFHVWHIATNTVFECPVYSLLNGLLFASPISRPWPKKVTLAICLCLPKPKKVLLIITLAHFAYILPCTSGQVTNRKSTVPHFFVCCKSNAFLAVQQTAQ